MPSRTVPLPHSLLKPGRRRFVRLAILGVACSWLGCQTALLTPSDAALDRLLKPVTTSPNSVTLEIYESRIPLEQDEQIEGVWNLVDEQCLDADLRRRLFANGLRAGVVGGSLPDEIATMLELQSEMPAEETDRLITATTAVPRTTKRVVHVNRLEPRTIHASEVRPEASILLSDDGQVHGKTFRQVEGRYELSAEAIPGQRVAVRLSPELDHGQLRNRYSGSDQGALMIIPSRERETFERLVMSVELAPGEFLVVGCLPNAEATLGGILHTVSTKGRNERKFILIRVLETPPSEILAKK